MNNEDKKDYLLKTFPENKWIRRKELQSTFPNLAAEETENILEIFRTEGLVLFSDDSWKISGNGLDIKNDLKNKGFVAKKTLSETKARNEENTHKLAHESHRWQKYSGVIAIVVSLISMIISILSYLKSSH